MAKLEAQALAEEVTSLRFLICSVVWCELLTITNQVNNKLLSSSIQLEIAVRLIDSAKINFSKYSLDLMRLCQLPMNSMRP